jgi:general secretion pathway protein I
MRPRAEEGFTLLEVIVALAIAAASVASLYKIYAVGWRGVRLAGIDSAAIEVARTQLASAGIETPLEDGTFSGVSPDGIEWTSEIRSYLPPDEQGIPFPPSAEAKAPQAYWVRVRVVWKEGRARPERSLELETIKLKVSP